MLAPAESVPQTPVTPATEPLALPEPVNNEATISKHPEYVKYFKMLNMGIPSEQIKMKMNMEGKVAAALESVLSLLLSSTEDFLTLVIDSLSLSFLFSLICNRRTPDAPASRFLKASAGSDDDSFGNDSEPEFSDDSFGD